MDTIDLALLPQTKHPLNDATCQRCHTKGNLKQHGGNQAKCHHCGKTYRLLNTGKIKNAPLG